MMKVPTVDLKGKPTDAAIEIGMSLQELGFVILVNHGVSFVLFDDAYKAAAEVFRLEARVKQRYETPKNGRQTGYTSSRIERAVGEAVPDNKEFWHVMRPGNAFAQNVFPKEVVAFEDATVKLFRALEECGNRVLGLIGMYLGYEAQHFEKMVANGNSVLRVLHYPPYEGGEEGVRAAAHTDINLLTLLPAATQAGLEIQLKNGSWIQVQPPPNALIVNAGDMLQMHTFGRIVSTLHRVVNPSAKSGSRYSLPFFLHPRAEVPLVRAGDFLQHRLRENGVKA